MRAFWCFISSVRDENVRLKNKTGAPTIKSQGGWVQYENPTSDFHVVYCVKLTISSELARGSGYHERRYTTEQNVPIVSRSYETQQMVSYQIKLICCGNLASFIFFARGLHFYEENKP